jgi:hypothetical protein
MYSKKVIARRQGELEKTLPFKLTPHTIEMVASVNGHLDSLLDPETGNTTRKLKTDEVQWIQNERAMCQSDFRYWATRYAFLKDWQSRLVRFAPSIAQGIYLDVCSELEEEGRAIALQILKARQLGMSTITELCVAHRVQFYPQINAVIASSDPDKSAIMAKMMELCWEHQPWWLMPIKTKHKYGELIEFGKMNSAVSIQHGTQFSGIARGTTPTAAHLSEVCDFDKPEALIDSSLLRAMHESPWMFLVLESTASGRHNWWHNTWELSKAGWKDKTSRLRPMFLPWFVGRDIYPTSTWLHSRPVPKKWVPSPVTEKHAQRARSYVKSNDLLRKHLGDEWKMPIEQMWYWQVQREEAEKKNILPQFYSEMPADDTEAFQSTAISVFPLEVITNYRGSINEPLAVYSVVSPDVPERLRPARRDIDPDQRPIHISAPMKQGGRFNADLVPLKFNGYSGGDFSNKLFVWHYPKDNEEYALGIDTADGVGKDRTAIEVIRKGDIENNDLQAAEWASPFVNSYDLAPFAYAIGTLFSTKIDGERRQAKQVIEINRNGEATQLELRKMGWTHFHVWQRYDNKRMKTNNSNKLGWFTNIWSRTMMMDFLVKMLRDEMVDVNSPWFVDEMSDLEASEDRQALRATYGGHDDRIMAAGMALFSMHALELKGTQRNLLKGRAEQRNEGTAYPTYSPGFQGRDVDEFDSVYPYTLYQHDETVDETEIDFGDPGWKRAR